MSEACVKRVRSAVVSVAALFAMMVAAPNVARADSITTLFSTGVDATGTPLSNGSIDPHYSVGGSAYVIGCPSCVGWVDNSSTASWISPDPSTYAGGGPFTFETTFDLTGFDPTTAVITGSIAADDQADVILNGTTVFSTVSTYSSPWSFYEALNISTGFVAGLNTLDIYVPNNIQTSNDGPTGLALDVSGTAAPVPEPASLTLLGTGILGVLARRRKNRLAIQ
jgi:hypothetical protein